MENIEKTITEMRAGIARIWRGLDEIEEALARRGAQGPGEGGQPAWRDPAGDEIDAYLKGAECGGIAPPLTSAPDAVSAEVEADGEDVVLEITAQDGHTYRADLLSCFTAEGRDYCAVLSHETEIDGTHQIQFFAYTLYAGGDGTETMELANIGSDDDYRAALSAFEAIMDGDEEGIVPVASRPAEGKAIVKDDEGVERVVDVLHAFEAGGRAYVAVDLGGRTVFFRSLGEGKTDRIFSDMELDDVRATYNKLFG